MKDNSEANSAQAQKKQIRMKKFQDKSQVQLQGSKEKKEGKAWK